MSNAMIGSLRVALGLDTAQFASGATKAKGIASSLSSSMKGLFAGMVAGLSLAGITAALKSSVDHMDELGKVAQKIGIPVDELSKLQYAAELSDISIGDLQGSVSKLSKQLADIQGGANNDAAYALETLGIKAVDASGKLRPTGDIIKDVAAKFAGFKDGASKTALAMALFGKSGADMIPLLNGGADAIKAAGDELQRFGGVVTPEAAANAETFNDNMTKLKRATESVAQKFVEGLTPALIDVTNMMIDSIHGSDVFRAAGKAMGEVVKALAAAFVVLGAQIRATYDVLAAFVTSALLAGQGRFSDAAKSVKDYFIDAYDTAKGTLDKINKLYMDPKSFGTQWTFTPPKLTDPGFSLAKLHERDAAAARAHQKAIEDAKRSYEAMKREAAQIFEQTRTPLEAYQAEIKKLNTLLEKGLISHDTYARAVKQLQDEFADTAKVADETAKKIEDSFTSAFDSWIDQAIDGTFNLKNALNDLLGDLTKLLLHQAFQSLLNPDVAPSQQGGGGLFGMIGNLIGGLFGTTLSSLSGPQSVRPSETAGRNGVSKLVLEYRNAPPQVEQRRGADGNLELVVREMVSNDIASGRHDNAMMRFGLRPSPKVR